MLYAAAGILPFCTVFIELYFALSSMWQGYFYYLFGFLFIVAFLMITITAEVSILCTCATTCVPLVCCRFLLLLLFVFHSSCFSCSCFPGCPSHRM